MRANDGRESRAGGILALAEPLRGQPEAAGRALSSGIPQWRAAAERPLAVRACHHLGQIQRARGRVHAAAGLYLQALEITAAPGHPALPGPGIAYVAWPGR